MACKQRFPAVVEKHYVDEIGTNILINCGVDMTDAINTSFKVQKPDETEVTWDATPFTLDGCPDYLMYTLIDGDFDQAGVYKINPYAEWPAAWSGRGTTVTILVYEDYD